MIPRLNHPLERGSGRLESVAINSRNSLTASTTQHGLCRANQAVVYGLSLTAQLDCVRARRGDALRGRAVLVTTASLRFLALGNPPQATACRLY